MTTENTASGGLDLPAIEALWAGDEDIYNEIAGIFIGELDDRLSKIADLAPADLEIEAHSLKGAAANIGASQLSALAAELEQASRENAANRIQDLRQSVLDEAALVTDQLQARIKGA